MIRLTATHPELMKVDLPGQFPKGVSEALGVNRICFFLFVFSFVFLFVCLFAFLLRSVFETKQLKQSLIERKKFRHFATRKFDELPHCSLAS